MRVLITGAAGFIGAALSQKLAALGHTVIGVDNLNDYYDVQLKRDRLQLLHGCADFTFDEFDLCDAAKLDQLVADHSPDRVVHLAAQAGVRYSLENPQAYIDSNLVGFANILEACRHHGQIPLIYASSSSVYGANKNFPFKETDRVDNPVSLYAATKKANELMAHSYSSLYQIPCVGLRFFTVYGPWGRPDMAPMRFALRMLAGEPIPVYNNGDMIRDFTYIDDIIEGVTRMVEADALPDYAVYNIGRGEPVQLMEFVSALEAHLEVKAEINYLPMQDGDVPRTMADTSQLQADFGYSPKISIEEGVKQFAHWYKDYHTG